MGSASSIVSRVEIAAPVEKAEEVLSDGGFWREGSGQTCFRVSRAGGAALESLRALLAGDELEAKFWMRGEVDVDPPGFEASPRVVEAGAGKLVWLGHLGCAGVFDGRHSFLLVENESGDGCVLHHSEEFSGCLVPFLFPAIRADTEAMFQRFNQEFKAIVEENVD